VEDGFLKITARAEEFEGSSYTSARIQSYQKFEFQYGKVEVRAKLPAGGGTWPAIWMLGADFETNTWPAAGEIDIMEHVGNQQNTIYGSTHDPNNFAGDSRSVTTVVEGVSDDFHVYGLEWTQDAITFSVDGEEFGTLENNGGLPFNKDFFMILNVAMGGNFGGEINPAFTGSSMEVDYIRVYQ
jgi:beta-glucanase (GH16 family)